MSGTASTLAMNIKKYKNRDYTELLNQCLSKRQLFCDPCFPAAPESLGIKELSCDFSATKGVEWKRPTEVRSNPQFIVKGATRSDICQGSLGDCWLLAAVASLTLNQDILKHVIYPEQNFEKETYAGIFHFRLWQYGEWVDVVVDDRLPTQNGAMKFMKAKNNEFWSALLEKAYAKVNGCYENLIGGYASEAFEDFTGGISENYMLTAVPSNMFYIMKKALSRGSLLNTYILPDREKETVCKEQLVVNHAYSITGTEEVYVNNTLVELVRLRNPWGHGEWNGAWSDGSEEWNQVLPAEKAKLNYKADDGEFWMTYADYVQRYSRLEICNLTPDLTESDNPRCCNCFTFEGMWEKDTTAGGSTDYPATFSTNPQFWVKLDIDTDEDNKCSVLVALMQKGAREKKQTGFSGYRIGFYIYKVPTKYAGQQDARLGPDDLKTPVAKATCVTMREISKRFTLPLDEYVIIPATNKPNQETSFLLRVFSEK